MRKCSQRSRKEPPGICYSDRGDPRKAEDISANDGNSLRLWDIRVAEYQAVARVCLLCSRKAGGCLCPAQH